MHLVVGSPWTTPSFTEGSSASKFPWQKNGHEGSPLGYVQRDNLSRSKTLPSSLPNSLPPSRPTSQQAVTRPSKRQSWTPVASQQLSSSPSVMSSPATSKTLSSSLSVSSRPGSQQSLRRPVSKDQGWSPGSSQQSAAPSTRGVSRSVSSPRKKRQDFVGYGDPWLKQAKMLNSYFGPSKACESPSALRKHLKTSSGILGWDSACKSSGPEPALRESPTASSPWSNQKKQPVVASTFLDLATSPKKGQTNSTKSEFMQKKASASKAIAQDRCRIDVQLAKARERSAAENRQRRDYERKLARCFAPIQEPHKHIPPPWQDLDVTINTVREHKCQKGENWVSLDMTPDELGSLAKLCSSFAHLMRPYVDNQPEADREPPFLTRPAFCRLLIELNLGDVHGELMYHCALDMFDALCAQATLKGCSMVAGQVSGLWVDDYDDKTLQLFTSLLSMIVTEAQELASRLTVDDLKEYLFTDLIIKAERKCRKRGRQMTRHMRQGFSMFRVPVGKPQLDDAGGESVSYQQLQTWKNGEQFGRQQLAASVESGRVNDRVKIAVDKLQGGRRGSNSSIDIFGRRKSRDSVEPKPEAAEEETAKRNDSQDIDCMTVDDRGSQSSKENLLPPANVPTTLSTPEDSDQEEQMLEESLYTHTNRVSKGEYLTNMLLEPEAMHLVWMFYDSFSTLFESYSDYSTEFVEHIGHGGHMSQEAFLHFCIDFGLFPALVDLNSICCLFVSAESTLEISRNYIKKRVIKDKASCSFEQGSTVQFVPRSTMAGARASALPSDVKPGEALKVLALDFTDVDAEAAFLLSGRGKKLWARLWDLELSTKPFSTTSTSDKKNKAHYRDMWINKGIDAMTPAEQKGLTILSSFSDFMLTHKLRSKDFFSRFDEDESMDIGVEEFYKGVMFMQLGGHLRTSAGTPPPAYEDVQGLFDLIDMDGGGTLDYKELDIVIKTVQERKARHGKENIFLKDHDSMTESEVAAKDFFVPLYHVMEARGWTAENLLKEFDKDHDDDLSCAECLAAGAALGIEASEETRANFDKALMILDSNFDGGLSQNELQRICDFVRDAIKAGEEFEIPNPYLQEILAKRQDKMVSVFGLKTFIEIVLKIGLGFLCFHGTPEQSTLPVGAKVVWLLTYLQWQLSQPVPEDEDPIDRKLATALETFGTCRTSLSDVLKEFAQKGYKPKLGGDVEPSCNLDAKKTLQEDEPHLFRQGATEEPNLLGQNVSREEGKPCVACGFEPIEGWGNPSCSLCGQGDAILKACLINARDNLPALHKVVTLLGTSKKPRTHNQIVRTQDKEKKHEFLRGISAWQS